LFLGSRLAAQFLYDQLIGVLTMARKATGKKAAKAASKVLRDKRTSKASKTAAGSALSQREKGSRKRK
jgi:type IV secretory pathway VirB6-like protein